MKLIKNQVYQFLVVPKVLEHTMWLISANERFYIQTQIQTRLGFLMSEFYNLGKVNTEMIDND